MVTLEELQQQFADAVLKQDEAALCDVINAEGISPAGRVDIYRNNVMVGLQRVMMARYPVVCKLVDERFFKYAVAEYIKQHPSESGNLDDYGKAFAEFLSAFEPTKPFAFLPDTARLEWAHHECYRAAEHEKIDAVALSKLPPESYEHLRFTLHPSVQLLCSEYPLDVLWALGQGNENEDSIELPERGVELLLVRPDTEVQQIVLEKGEYAYLNALAEGGTFLKAYETAIKEHEGFDLGGALQKFVSNGVCVAFSIA